MKRAWITNSLWLTWTRYLGISNANSVFLLVLTHVESVSLVRSIHASRCFVCRLVTILCLSNKHYLLLYTLKNRKWNRIALFGPGQFTWCISHTSSSLLHLFPVAFGLECGEAGPLKRCNFMINEFESDIKTCSWNERSWSKDSPNFCESHFCFRFFLDERRRSDYGNCVSSFNGDSMEL